MKILGFILEWDFWGIWMDLLLDLYRKELSLGSWWNWHGGIRCIIDFSLSVDNGFFLVLNGFLVEMFQ